MQLIGYLVIFIVGCVIGHIVGFRRGVLGATEIFCEELAKGLKQINNSFKK